MSDIPDLTLALVAGLLLGTLFFGGLWWTVQKALTSEMPALWFVGSLLLRTGVILAGFTFVAQNHWSRLVMCLLGFMIARVFVIKRLTQGSAEEPAPLEEETSSAPYSR
jgi:F1F0 ATPase subunit 2